MCILIHVSIYDAYCIYIYDSLCNFLRVVLFSMNLLLTLCCNFIEQTAIGLCVVLRAFEATPKRLRITVKRIFFS